MSTINDVSFVIYNTNSDKFLSKMEVTKVLTPEVEWGDDFPYHFDTPVRAINSAKQLIKVGLCLQDALIVVKIFYYINTEESVIDTYVDFSDLLWDGMYDY